MITEVGLSAILKAFAEDDKGPHRISRIVFGNIRLNSSDEPEFEPEYVHVIRRGQIYLLEDNIFRVNITINSDDVVDGYDVREFTVVQLLCDSGEIFAWRNFEPRPLGAGTRITMRWDIGMLDIADDVIESAHVHLDKDALDKLGEHQDGTPTYDGDRLNRYRWRGDVW